MTTKDRQRILRRATTEYKEENRGYKTPCRIWTGAVLTKRSECKGKISVGGRSHIAVTRAIMAAMGKLNLDDMKAQVNHHCDQPDCIRYDHLYVGTALDNVMDCVNRKRNNPPVGVRNGGTKLTEKQAKAIRADPRNQYEIAKSYKIRQGTVSKIKREELWGHLDSPLVFNRHVPRSRGTENGMNKLTETQVLEIRKKRGTCKQVGLLYGVSPMTISRIKRKELWKHL